MDYKKLWIALGMVMTISFAVLGGCLSEQTGYVAEGEWEVREFEPPRR